MKTLSIILLCCSVSAEAADTIKQLDWLSGCWGGRLGPVAVEECWQPPRLGRMLAINQSWSENAKALPGVPGPQFEFLRIEQSATGLLYRAQPGGKPVTDFRLKSLGKHEVVFENLTHDYPQRISYRRDKDTLHVRTEGNINGEMQSEEWQWKKINP